MVYLHFYVFLFQCTLIAFLLLSVYLNSATKARTVFYQHLAGLTKYLSSQASIKRKTQMSKSIVREILSASVGGLYRQNWRGE